MKFYGTLAIVTMAVTAGFCLEKNPNNLTAMTYTTNNPFEGQLKSSGQEKIEPNEAGKNSMTQWYNYLVKTMTPLDDIVRGFQIFAQKAKNDPRSTDIAIRYILGVSNLKQLPIVQIQAANALIDIINGPSFLAAKKAIEAYDSLLKKNAHNNLAKSEMIVLIQIVVMHNPSTAVANEILKMLKSHMEKSDISDLSSSREYFVQIKENGCSNICPLPPIGRTAHP